MSICIFPGTFNPIHIGHLKMAEFALRKYNFEKIIFIPAFIPPHKDINTELAKHRYKMVKLAVKYNPHFEVSDIEFLSEGKSYTLLTVKKLFEHYNLKSRLNFIIGTDAFKKIESWYKPEELKELVHFIVFPRSGDSIEELDYLRKKGWSFEITNMQMVDISSTEIRSGYECDKIESVEVYIKEHGLYNL